MNPHNLIYTDSALNTAIRMSSTASTQDVKTRPNARYTKEEIITMKLLFHWDRKTYNELAEMYDTNYQSVYRIINKLKYKEVPLNHMTKIPESFHVLTNGKYRSFKVKGHN